MKVVINTCYGGFGLSEAAYEKLAEWGVPIRKYVEQQRDPETGLYRQEPANDGEAIFDHELTPLGECSFTDLYHKYKPSALGGRYWDSWTRKNRTHPLVVRVVETLGEQANGPHAKLKVVEVPDDVAWEIDDNDGNEHIAETHRTWW